jgi:hypothetical protein
MPMPIAPIMLPRRAVRGWFISCSANMNSEKATM